MVVFVLGQSLRLEGNHQIMVVVLSRRCVNLPVLACSFALVSDLRDKENLACAIQSTLALTVPRADIGVFALVFWFAV